MSRSLLLLDGRTLLDAERLLRSGLAERRASFELSLARMPPHTGFAVVAGVETLLERLSKPLVDPGEIEFVRRTAGFGEELTSRLGRLSLSIDIDAVPDGTLAFVPTPIVSIEGPFFEAILIGRLAHAIIQRATAIATRTARLHIAADGQPIIEASSATTASTEASVAMARAAYTGGASATTNPIAAAMLQIPFRAESKLELGTLAAHKSSGGWGDLPEDVTIELGSGDDEEALLLEAKRRGTQAAAWIARGLGESSAVPTMRYELTALEENGAWAPRRGTSGDSDVVPGRKRVARYCDANGRAVADVMHLNNERIQPPKSLGAVTLAPFMRSVLRGGRTLEAAEAAIVGRERAIAARQLFNPAILFLRRPATYRVEFSHGVEALRAEHRK